MFRLIVLAVVFLGGMGVAEAQCYRNRPVHRYRSERVYRSSYHRSYSSFRQTSYYQSAPVYVAPVPIYAAPAPVVVIRPTAVVEVRVVEACPIEPVAIQGVVIMVPQGFRVEAHRFHRHGGNAGQIDWVRGCYPSGRRAKLEYDDCGRFQEDD